MDVTQEEYSNFIKRLLNSKYGFGGATCVMDDIHKRMTYSEHIKKNAMLDKIEKVIFNNPATIIIWSDGTKTVVKCNREKFDPEKGLAMAISKKLLGNNQGYYYEVFKKWLPKEKTKIGGCQEVPMEPVNLKDTKYMA